MAEKEPVNRRDFLKLAGTTAPVAAVAVASSAKVVEASAPDPTRETMQDTLHTRAYYDTAQF